ncbi:MAG: oligosaccharide flippase family protein [Erysipelotrichaceae bacterium]|nr:oligosaccharide flippase family protein [Erysipelotrichaceae bacterium]
MDRKLFVNYFYNILYQVVTILVPLITVPYTTRVIGDIGLGVNAFSASIVQWFTIFGIMGINNYGIRTIGANRDDRKNLSKTFYEIFLMQIINLSIMVILYLVFITIYPFEYKIVYLIQVISLFATMLDITWFFLGIEEFRLASLRNILIKITGIVLIFTFVKSKDDLLIFILINVLTALFGQFIMFIQLPKFIDKERVTLKESYQNHFKQNMILFVPQIASSVYNVLDQTLVGILATDWESQSAFYQQTIRFVKMFLYFITSIGSVMLPRIANIHKKGDSEMINTYVSATFRLALYLAIPMMFGMMSVAPFFIPWFLAKEFSVVGTLIMITSPIILFISLSNVFGIQYLLPTGMMSKYSASIVLGAIVNLIMNLVMIPIYGALGACISIVTAEFIVVLSQWFFVRNSLTLKVKMKSILIYFIAGLLMAFAVYYIGTMNNANIKTNLLQIGAGVVIYIGFLTITKEEFHFLIIFKIKELLIRTKQ